MFFQPSNEQLMAFAERRLHISQSRLELVSRSWNQNYLLHRLGPALRNANIQLIDDEDYPSVMD